MLLTCTSKHAALASCLSNSVLAVIHACYLGSPFIYTEKIWPPYIHGIRNTSPSLLFDVAQDDDTTHQSNSTVAEFSISYTIELKDLPLISCAYFLLLYTLPQLHLPSKTIMAYSESCRPSSRSLATKPSFLSAAAQELEALRCCPTEQHGHAAVARDVGMHFPPACRAFLLSLAGNSHCADCGSPRPEWASVSYGILLCVQCCGRHRSYGVQNSRVRSIDMDTWNHSQVLSMLEGGNDQLGRFFERHEMHHNNAAQSRNSADMMCKRYKTKAALFYRTNLQKHVEQVAEAGVYEGREAARRSASRSRSPPIASHHHRVTPPRTQSEPLQAMAQQQQQQHSMETRRPIQRHGIAAAHWWNCVF